MKSYKIKIGEKSIKVLVDNIEKSNKNSLYIHYKLPCTDYTFDLQSFDEYIKLIKKIVNEDGEDWLASSGRGEWLRIIDKEWILEFEKFFVYYNIAIRKDKIKKILK